LIGRALPALERGHLDHAVLPAREVAEGTGRPVSLDVALRFLPVIALERGEQYDEWARRWLVRWITETPAATIGRAAEVACSLGDAQSEPLALDSIRRSLS
jgi:hypothetical protein